MATLCDALITKRQMRPVVCRKLCRTYDRVAQRCKRRADNANDLISVYTLNQPLFKAWCIVVLLYHTQRYSRRAHRDNASEAYTSFADNLTLSPIPIIHSTTRRHPMGASNPKRHTHMCLPSLTLSTRDCTRRCADIIHWALPRGLVYVDMSNSNRQLPAVAHSIAREAGNGEKLPDPHPGYPPPSPSKHRLLAKAASRLLLQCA